MADETTRRAAAQADAAALAATLRRFARAASAPWLHGEVARRMAARLPVIRLQPQSVLQWWSWSGASDELLAAAYPKARRVLVEPTAALAARSTLAAQRPWWSAGRWRARTAEIVLEDEVAASSCQLLWANMMLHAVPDAAALLAQWQRALAADGFVMFSCLGPDTLKELRPLYARFGWGAAAQDFIDMHDIGDMMVHAGFADPVMDQETITLTFADAPALLAELRGLGGNAALRRHAGLRTPRWRQRLLRELEALAGAEGRIALGFEIVYGHAFKAAPRAKASAETSIPLEQMRTLVRGSRPPRG
jgi:malonyl-CoA O-methyltransferase